MTKGLDYKLVFYWIAGIVFVLVVGFGLWRLVLDVQSDHCIEYRTEISLLENIESEKAEFRVARLSGWITAHCHD